MTNTTFSSIEVGGSMDCDAEEPGLITPGQLPPDFAGLDEHGLVPAAEPGVVRRTIDSLVWGSGKATVNVAHGATATWDPCLTGKDRNCCPCCWYGYAEAQLCMKGCVHPGMDIGLAKRTPLYAAQSGTVAFVGYSGYFRPYHINIRTTAGEEHVYGHMWSIAPEVRRTGATVREGQILGTSGEQTRKDTCDPDGTGPHLHFERRERRGSTWCAIDPEPILRIRYCQPEPPPPFDGTVNDVVFHPDRRTVRCSTGGLRCRRWANQLACQTRAPLAKGETVEVDYWIRGEEVNREDRWWVARSGFRFWSGGTEEQPR